MTPRVGPHLALSLRRREEEEEEEEEEEAARKGVVRGPSEGAIKVAVTTAGLYKVFRICFCFCK